MAPTDVSTSTSYTYGGTALVPGMYYQFRVQSWQTISAVTQIASQSEDLKGVFYMP